MPVVTGEAVFIGSCSGTFYAFNRRSGQTLWTYNIKQDGNQSSFHGSMIVFDKRVVVGTDHGTDLAAEGHIYAFDSGTGKAAWKYAASTGVSTDLLRDDSRLIAYCANGELVSLDLQSGKPAWKKKITEPNSDQYLSSPVLLGHVVYAATATSAVVAVRTTDGEVLWRRQLEAGYLQIVVLGNELYVLSGAKYLYRLDKVTGDVRAKNDLQAVPYFVPSPAADSILVEFSDHTLKHISKGDPVWSVKFESDLTTHKPLVLQHQVIVADATGKLSAWRLEDGAPLWSTVFQHLKSPITTVGSDAEMLYVGTQDGTLFGVDRHKLERRQE